MTDEETIEAALLGEKVREFVESDVGMGLIILAERDALSALEKLADVDPDDTKTIRKLQGEVKLYQSFKGWLSELVSRGEEAEKVYKQQRDNDES